MEFLNNLVLGFGEALTLTNLAFCLLGALLGTLIGVLPGIGPTATIAVLLPITFFLPPLAGIIMLAGIYYGAQYGGSTTAILVNLPGESSSVVTVIDGYQMARKGRAGPALAAAGMGSFFAGCVGTLILAAFAPPLTEIALISDPWASTTAETRPSTIREKYSAGPNLSATSASGGANIATIRVATQPAKNEPSAATVSAGPARPRRAIW